MNRASHVDFPELWRLYFEGLLMKTIAPGARGFEEHEIDGFVPHPLVFYALMVSGVIWSTSDASEAP